MDFNSYTPQHTEDVREDTKRVGGLEETQRRQAVADVSQMETTDSKMPLIYETDEMAVEGQTTFLVNLANVGMSPRCQRPAFRILGAFPTRKHARDHGQRVVAQLPKCGLHVVSAQKVVIIAKNMEQQYNPTHVDGHVSALLENHFASIAEKRAAFVAKVKAAKEKPTEEAATPAAKEPEITYLGEEKKEQKKKRKPKTTAAVRQRAVKKVTEMKAGSEESMCTAAVPRDCELRNQSVAVVCVLPDTVDRAVPQPCIIYCGTFRDTSDADKWIKRAKETVNCAFHFDVVDMYEWLFPEDVDCDKINEVYSNSELSKIMSQRKTQGKEVKSFQKWCANENVSAPVTNVGCVDEEEDEEKDGEEGEEEAEEDLETQAARVRKPGLVNQSPSMTVAEVRVSNTPAGEHPEDLSGTVVLDLDKVVLPPLATTSSEQ